MSARDVNPPRRIFVALGADGSELLGAFADRDAALAAHPDALVVEYVAMPPAASRDQPWGDGQFDEVELAPGVRAALRVTRDGRAKLFITGGELDVTAGGCALGLGLIEATRRAAEIRVRADERKARRGGRR